MSVKPDISVYYRNVYTVELDRKWDGRVVIWLCGKDGPCEMIQLCPIEHETIEIKTNSN